MRRHVHPITIVANLWQVLYLIIIPLLRSFVLALQGDLGQWVQGAWIDILVFLVMIAVAVWRWWVVTYSFDETRIVLDTGWFMRRRIRMPWSRVTTISMLRPFFLRPFGAVRLRADTIGGRTKDVDFSMLLSRREAELLLQRGQGDDAARYPREYVPQTRTILSLALLTSNSLGGIIFVATFVSQSGRILGNGFSDLLIGTFEEATRSYSLGGLPPAAAAIAYALLIGWLIGFLLTFLRYKNFLLSRRKDSLHIEGGLLTTREYRIQYDHISFVDIRQSVVTKALKLYSLYICAVGYGKLSSDISCIIPTEGQSLFNLNRRRLFPSFDPVPRQIAPPRGGFMRYIGVALSLCGATLVATFLLIWLFPNWRDFILFVGLMTMLPATLFLIVQIIDFATAGLAQSGDYYTIRYSSGFNLHTVVIPKGSVVSIELRQSFIQKFSPNCDLIICTRAEKRTTHLCRNLNREALRAALDL